ncbi:MAG TPA: phosphopantetheine-binding protein [Steroidobacteraceae bacterium]|nr:phosphopantetheine-binding protein [Steroidobacteraceae bacterium]
MSDPAIDVDRLRALLREHLHVDVPSPEVDLLESGVLDSLQLVDLLLLVEQRFGRRIAIESVDLDDLRSLGRLARLLNDPPAGDGGAGPEPRVADLRAVRRRGASRRD